MPRIRRNCYAARGFACVDARPRRAPAAITFLFDDLANACHLASVMNEQLERYGS
jgi:hypothetical protein